MEVRSYKGYEIQAVPDQLPGTGDWTINIQIAHAYGNKIRWRQFSDGNFFKMREEAIANCFNFGRRIIDGKFENCTVADL